jgi:dTDP-4-amino-4,6-dideoxygalactose transaminase
MDKSGIKDLAIHGGTPLFDEPVHVGQVNFPDWDKLETAFRGIFSRRFYANHGPLERELDERLASYLGVRHAISITNGTLALMILARAMELKGKVVVPAFTFPGTVQALSWAGLVPQFCDVDLKTHNISTATVESQLGPETAAILGVHLWGRACDVDGLRGLAEERGLILLYDAAHAFGCTAGGRYIGGFGAAEMFSFHATKVLNAAEGGCITTNDDEVAAKVRTMRTFHESETRADVEFRMNGKISEAQAALALCSLDDLQTNIDGNKSRYDLYQRRLTSVSGVEFIDHAYGEKSNYQYVVVRIDEGVAGISRNRLMQTLRAENVLARAYFSPGVHRASPYREQYPENLTALPVTDELSKSLMQLPTGQTVSAEDVEQVCGLIKFILNDV